MKVLIADDEKTLGSLLKDILRRENIDCDAVYNGADAVEHAANFQYDLIVLDIMMPKMNGYEAVKAIRMRKISAPVLFLSAKSEVGDKVEGLNYGADDYLTKPFAAAEFVARVKALARRQPSFTGDDLSFADITLSKNTYILRGEGGEVKLGNIEFKIMEMLMKASKSIVNKSRLIEKVWGWDNEAEYNNAEVYVSFLRKKLMAIKSKAAIKAVRGVGYRLEAEDDGD